MAALLLSLSFGIVPTLTAADDGKHVMFDIPASSAAQALKKLADQSGQQLLYSNNDLAGVTTNAVKGELTTQVALSRLLAGTPLVATRDQKSGAIAVGRESTSPNEPRAAQTRESDRPASPQQPGMLTGTASNGATGAYLEGAQVVLQPGNFSVLTERDGRFTFPRLMPGDYTLTVSYAALDAKTIPVTVRGAAVSVGEIALTAAIYKLADFVVEGEREGNALAVQQQHNAPNIKNVISSDAFGNVADLNVGNFLMRLPGFSPEISEGEIVRVQIRGTSSDLSSFSVDGTRAANGTTSTFNRAPDIDRMSVDFIETIEVTKAITPDIDADSIGGAVNMKTKNPLDRKGRRINYNFGENYNVAQGTFRPLGNVGYSNVLRDGKLGVLFTASYNETNKPRDEQALFWEATTDTSRPAWFYANIFGRDQLRHTRGGAGLRIDYKLSPSTRVYVNTMFTNYRDQLNRRWVRLSRPTNANVLLATPTVTEAKGQTFKWFQMLRNRAVDTLSFTAGGESTIWGGKLDFNANYSPSRGTDLDSLYPHRTIAGVQFREERVGTHNGVRLTQTGGPDVLDWRNSIISPLENPSTRGDDNIFGAQINFRKPFAWRFPVTAKSGLRFRSETRDRDNTYHVYSYVGPDGVAGPSGGTNDDNLERFYDPGFDYKPIKSSYPKMAGMPSQFMNLAALRAELRNAPQLFKEDLVTSTRDSIINDNKVSEDVSAAYLQGETQLGRLGILGGVRIEETRVRGRGHKQEITPAEKARRAAWVGTVTPEETVRRTLAEYGNPTEASRSYDSVFPSIHFKYGFTKNLLARASFSTGIGRPNFGSIVPTMNINNENQTITANNPGLKPQYSDNYDVTLEYYFPPAGMATIAAFEKHISDFIFRQSGGELPPGNQFGEAYNGYRLTTDFNGGSARIRGLEVSWQQQFQNLPGFWRGFGAFANFTWLETRGNYGTPGATKTSAELANFTPRTGNFGISYIDHQWTIRLLVNHTGRRLIGYNADPSLREWQYASTPIDLKFAYALSRRLSLYCDIIDVFNVGRQNQYIYIPERKATTILYSTIVKFGVSGNF
jgi:TonB-dependent receptor